MIEAARKQQQASKQSDHRKANLIQLDLIRLMR